MENSCNASRRSENAYWVEVLNSKCAIIKPVLKNTFKLLFSKIFFHIIFHTLIITLRLNNVYV